MHLTKSRMKRAAGVIVLIAFVATIVYNYSVVSLIINDKQERQEGTQAPAAAPKSNKSNALLEKYLANRTTGIRLPKSIYDPKKDNWTIHLSRGVTISMLNLTTGSEKEVDCKRMPSWRSNEKRFIRLNLERSLMKSCAEASKHPTTQLFGLRAVNDTMQRSYHQYIDYSHPKAAHLDEDADDVAWMLYDHIRSKTQRSKAAVDVPEDDEEWNRWYSLVSIASNPMFLWKESLKVAEGDDTGDEIGTNQLQQLIDAKRLMFEDTVETGGKKSASGSRQRLILNVDAIEQCPFNRSPSLLSYDDSPFAMEGYEMIQFLQHAFAHHGWISIPTAGTALGAMRHFGMLRGDDDMDIVATPPAQYLRKPYRDSGKGTTFDYIYEDFDALVEKYGADHLDTFFWFQNNDYRNNNRSVKGGPWFTRRDMLKRLPSAFSYSNFNHHIRQESRICQTQYTSWNTIERRRLFATEACVGNHWINCIQPGQYFYRSHSEVLERHLLGNMTFLFVGEEDDELNEQLADPGPSIFTAFHRRPMGKICRCRFGHRPGFQRSDPEGFTYALCPSNLVDFINYWYDSKWCVSSGAVRTRKWVFLKSWND